MKKNTFVALIAVVAASFAGAPAHAGTGYLAGAAKIDISPPSTGHRVGELCPSKFDGPTIWDYDEPYIDQNGSGDYDFGEPYCDANGNGRYDGIWVVGSANHHAHVLNDPLWARAFAVSDGTDTLVVVSVDSLGLFNSDIDRATALVRAALGDHVHVIVSANHNESTPDSIGLWGPGDNPLGIGFTSGVDDYYMTFLEQQIAKAAIAAASPSVMQPATLRILETRDDNVLAHLNSGGFPTSNKGESSSATPNPQIAGRIDAWNPKVKILEADGAHGIIFRMMNYDTHMQNTGHSDDPYWGHALTGDWNGFYNDDVEADCHCVSVYVAGTIERSSSVGHELARAVDAAAPDAQVLAPGAIRFAHSRFEIPLENQLFIAAFAAGLFPHKTLSAAPADANSIAIGRPWLQTDVSVARIGPLEFGANPGEAFPGLLKGSHWGIDEVCGARPNPPVPEQHSNAAYRWDIGLAGDMIGYELPAWGWDSDQTTYADPRDTCSMNGSPGGHRHGLEDESTGPTGANMVAQQMTDLVAAVDGPNQNQILPGRYVLNGGLSRRPYHAQFQPSDEDAGHMPVVDAAATGIVYGADHRTATAGTDGSFVDFDGHPQAAPDVTTRGFQLNDGTTIFLDVYPAYA